MRQVELQDFCDFVQGGRQKFSGKHFVECGFPAFGAGGLNGFLPTAEFKKDGVVLSSIGARCGKCFLAQGKWSSLANTQIIFPRPDQADVRFLWYQLNDEHRWLRRGVAQPFIRPSDVKAHLVFLPPLSEQRRIAAVLDRADALRRRRRDALALLDALPGAVFAEIIGTNPGEVETRPLKNLGRVVTGATPPSRAEGMFGGAVPFVTPGDLESDARAARTLTAGGASAVRLVRKGAALVCCIGATIGKMGMANTTAAFNQQINAVEWGEEVLPYYGLTALRAQRERVIGMATQTTLPILKKSLFEKIEIPVMAMAVQQRFEAAAEKTEAVRERMKAEISGLEALFASLQARAFSGEL